MENDLQRMHLDAAMFSGTAKHGVLLARGSRVENVGLLLAIPDSSRIEQMHTPLLIRHLFYTTLVAMFVTCSIHIPRNGHHVYFPMRGSPSYFGLQGTHYDYIDPSLYVYRSPKHSSFTSIA
jgi:hypothetical protein